MLEEASRFCDATGFDFSNEAIRFCKKRGLSSIHKVNLERPLPKNVSKKRYDVIIAADIVEHLDDDAGVLRRLKPLLKKDGIIIISVPAYQWLWSNHDVSLHHKRRYTRRLLKRTVMSAGLVPRRLSYTNIFLFPAAASVRVIKRLLGNDTGTDSGNLLSPLNKVMIWGYSIERALFRVMSLPFGLSVVCIARRK
jgi:SAM-dependent methyltransferase